MLSRFLKHAQHGLFNHYNLGQKVIFPDAGGWNVVNILDQLFL